MKVLPLFAIVAFTITAAAQSATGNAASNVTAPHNTQLTNSAEATASHNDLNEATSTAARSGHAAASAAQASDISAQLTRSINSKNAKVGDAVEAKTTSKAILANGTKLPKGTRLLGHVTQVQRESHAQHTSELAFSFDHAILRSGREIPIHATLRSISAPRPMVDADSAFDGDANMGGAAMASSGRGAVRGGGGGLLGAGRGAVGGGSALAGGALRSSGNLAGGAVNSVDSTTANAGAATTAEMGAMANAGQRNLAGAVQTSANSNTQGELIPVGNMRGVSFYNTSGADSSAMLQGSGRNIDLYSGSQMTLAVSASH